MAGVPERSRLPWEEIVKKPNSGVKKVHQKLHLSFPPYYLADLKKSVASVLDSRLNNYEENLGGLLAGYGRISILKTVGETLFNLCEVHVDVEGDFYVFSPDVGIELIGTVNKKGYAHIGAVVHGLFNVSLPQSYKVPNQDWLGKTAKLQDQVKFVVTRVDLQAQVPFIEGNIVELFSHSEGEKTSMRERCYSDSGVSVASEESSASSNTEESLEMKKKSKLSLTKNKNEQAAVEIATPQPSSDKKRKRSNDSSLTETPKSKKTKSDDVLQLVSHLFSTIDEAKKVSSPTSSKEKKEKEVAPVPQPKEQRQPKKKKSKIKKEPETEDTEAIIQKLLSSNLPATPDQPPKVPKVSKSKRKLKEVEPKEDTEAIIQKLLQSNLPSSKAKHKPLKVKEPLENSLPLVEPPSSVPTPNSSKKKKKKKVEGTPA